MGEMEEAKAKAAAAYNAAADYFDHPVSSFWHRFGRQTIECPSRLTELSPSTLAQRATKCLSIVLDATDF